VLYVSLNSLEANFVTPAILGKSISLNPVTIILAILLWGWLWGIGGVLLAVPILLTAKIFCDHSNRFQAVGRFLER